MPMIVCRLSSTHSPPLVVAEMGPALVVQRAQDVRQMLAERPGRVVGMRRQLPGGRHARRQRHAVHPARAGIVPAVGLVAEVEALLVVDGPAVEDRAVEILERGLGRLVGQGDGQLVAGGLLVHARRSSG